MHSLAGMFDIYTDKVLEGDSLLLMIMTELEK